jgi:serine/threonine-protein kinase
MTRLSHPNIVQVLDFGRGQNDDYFLVMELITGVDLGKFCAFYEARGERMPRALCLFVAVQILRGLAYAHAIVSAEGERLVHRDISPGNVLLSTFGEVKVADFGVALVTAASASDAGTLAGKPAYMAPEQLARESVDERADLYAVGAVLFRMLTGESHRSEPVDLGSTSALRSLSSEARESLARHAPPPLVEIVLRALGPTPDARFAGAREMVRALESLTEHGEKLGSADELADAVTLVTREEEQSKPVVHLSAPRAGGDPSARAPC